MMYEKDVKAMLRSMSNNLKDNNAHLIERFKRFQVPRRDYLFVLTDELYDEKLCAKAIKSLIS